MPRHRWWSRANAVAGAAAVSLAGFLLPAAGATARPVLPTPASGTPQLAGTGTTEQVRQLAQCGGTMYAVGSFTKIATHGVTVSRHNAFSFSATAPYAVQPWNPDVNGTVNTIAFNGSSCTTAYLGGKFSSVRGTAAANIAAVSTSTGALVPGFAHHANGRVETIVRASGRLLTGGYFTAINGSSAHRYMASLNPVTGKVGGFLNLGISGTYHFCSATRCTSGNPTRVYNQQLSHGGTLDLVEGDFTRVGGLRRQQIFMLNVSGTTARVTGWTSPEWDGSKGNLPNGYPYQCWFNEPFYIRAAAWSPDDSTVYIATTGYRPWNLPGGSSPRRGLCDAAAAFPATRTSVLRKWINYTGCDSLYSAAADSSAAYFGGHERWSQNRRGCNFAGTGAIRAPGMEGLSPGNGSLLLNQQGTALYTRSRGLGADDMLLTGAGLWIASDNLSGSQMCGGADGHAGICFLPYPAQ